MTAGNFCVAGSAGMRGLQSNFWSLEVVWIAAAIFCSTSCSIDKSCTTACCKLLAPCDLQQADYVLVKVMLSTWFDSLSFCMLRTGDNLHFHCFPALHNGLLVLKCTCD